MRTSSPTERFSVVAALVILLSGCQQVDQLLPLDLAEGESATNTIGPNGGVVSFPPSFSMEFPSNAIGGSINVMITRRIDSPFPSSAGIVVPNTAFDVEPAGTALLAPVRVELAVDPTLLEVGEAVRLSIAVELLDGSVVTFPGTYDLTAGILVAEIDVLGSLAAVVAADAIPVLGGTPDPLGGGSIPTPVPPAPGAAPAPSYGGVEFSATCAPDSGSRQCFSSGLVRLWADQTVIDRMGEDLVLLQPELTASLEFFSFDQNGIPTQAVGSVSVGGELKARFNTLVTASELSDGVRTGGNPGNPDPEPTGLNVSGSVMFFNNTIGEDGVVDFNEDVHYSVVGIGTSEMLVIEVEASVSFPNDDGPDSIGYITAQVRLRR